MSKWTPCDSVPMKESKVTVATALVLFASLGYLSNIVLHDFHFLQLLNLHCVDAAE